ncbi:MAG: radical SAM protein [Candidatus Omnitrophica bacterium]|nr:radical SAM protein [Candidatus Omnitrophota bacterium]
MNILFTNFCNRNCPYCFARGKLVLGNKPASSYIKLNDLKKIIDFLICSRQNEVGIIGGEPTLHPEFKEAVRMILGKGLRIRIFSNGIIKSDNVLFLSKIEEAKCSIVLNINSPESYQKREWLILTRNMELLNKKHVYLGFNIYKLDFEMDFLTRLIQKYKFIKRIRVGLSMPLFGCSNKYLQIKDYPYIAGRLVDFAKRYWSSGIALDFDCGFMMCSFSDAQLGSLFRMGASLNFSCNPVIDVGPDLNLWRCFATSMKWNKKLSDFEDMEAVYSFYQAKFKAFMRIGATNSCFRCKQLKFAQCSGGCLGHVLKSFKV